MADTPRRPSWRTDKRKKAERGYGAAWQRARLAYLKRHPLCVMCQRDGRTTAAQVVDHIVKHEGNETMFWDENNWQPLCKPHHDSDKQMLEKSGEERTRFGPDGRVVW